jgi:hypothetical protein
VNDAAGTTPGHARASQHHGPIVLSRYHLGVLALFLFTILALWAIVFSWQAEHWAIQQFVAPSLERRFGYRGGVTALVSGSGFAGATFTLVKVDPDGALGRAGFRSGDIPSGAAHDNYVFFHRLLLHACDGRPERMRMLHAVDGKVMWPDSADDGFRTIPCVESRSAPDGPRH